MHANSLPDCGLFLFRPPYQYYHPVHLGWTPEEIFPGVSAVWFMANGGQIFGELEWLRTRPSWIPLIVILPSSEDLYPLASILKYLPELHSRAVLPATPRGLASALRTLLALPPKNLPKAAVEHLQKLNWIPDVQTKNVTEQIFSAGSHVKSVKELARTMCQSRRTLGRLFQDRELPVPSHWLQFARILHVTIHIQNTTLNINRVAVRHGYTDGFTMSNSMKRLTGCRPSFVRQHLGWEWLVEMWVKIEKTQYP